MSNSNASKSASSSANNSITSDTLSNGHSPLLWEGVNSFAVPCQLPDWEVQPPQYSWRRKATSDVSYNPPPKGDLSLEDLLRKKSYLLQSIAQEYSRLVGLMQEELDITGIEPKGYAESMRSYDKAVDDYECFQIFTDSLVVTVSQEAEVNTDAEKRALHRGTSYTLTPETLQKLTYGSLQNIVGAQEKERKCFNEGIDFTDENAAKSRNRASSAPREAFSAMAPCPATVSAAAATAQKIQPRPLKTPHKTSGPTSALSRPTLHRFFSLKSLSDSLPALSIRAPSHAARQSVGGQDGRSDGIDSSGGGEQLPPPMQPRRSLSRADPTKLDDLIAWKNVEIATVQNILRVNMARAMDTVLCRKSRKAYRDSAQENQKTLLRLYHESEQLKEARQSALTSRSLSVGRVEPPLSLPSHPFGIPLAFSPAHLPHPDGCLHCSQISHGDAATDSSSYHADEQSSNSSHSSTNQAHNTPLAISCHSSGSARAFNSVPACRKEVLSPFPCSKSPLNNFQDPPSNVRHEDLDEGIDAPKTSTNYVQYLFPNRTCQTAMRSYGRPNYSRHATTVLTQNRGADLSQFPSNHPFDQAPSHHSTQMPLVNSQDSLTQNANSATQNRVWPPSTCPPPTHFDEVSCGLKLVSELERLTNPLSRQIAPSEATSTPTTRTRFTLADKLNMCTTHFH
ncbi:unnamed protein product [Taenia asiatica]|uniref:Uncharacterized protein n=1 Tax=Taenia asiatica TaxID=60517 RepID=A0A0R3W539_TAEAS|nr:unnamed protein product [Taenia asiatica]